jgi:putative serine protease PepD
VKRLIAPMLLAALAGAVAVSVGAQLFGSGGRSAPAPRLATAPIGSTSSGTRREVSQTALTPTEIYKRDSPGVVSIKAVTSEAADSGTGIVLNNEGLILTNDHVVAGATSLTVASTGSSNVTRPATLVGEEANGDLALIRVDPSGLGLKPLSLASSSSVQVGDSVYAIGNPYGLNETLTKGIVSALGREIAAPDGAKITGVIQTDAALNPGNSGGPLLDEQGEVIGVNSQIASDAASVEGSQPGSTGVGFAIASNTVAGAIKKIEAGKGISSASASESRNESEATQSPYRGRSPFGTQGGEGEEAGSSAEAGSEADEAAVGGSRPAGAGSQGQVIIVP